MKELLNKLSDADINFLENENLSRYSSFKIGGAADFVALPDTAEKLQIAIRAAKAFDISYEVVGNGSNILFSDNGYRGMIVVTKNIRQMTFSEEGRVICGCGAMLPTLSASACERSLSGLEFACGIPGSVGGAVLMNAGAHGGQISDCLRSSIAYDAEKDAVVTLDGKDHFFSYRHSVYSDNRALVCLGAEFELSLSDKEKISEKMRENTEKRKNSQPLSKPSAGSFFKRPEGYFAAKLIDDCGLKGYIVGNAAVSEKHAGFIVNLGGATADEVLYLAEQVAEKVYDEFGVKLEREVRYIG